MFQLLILFQPSKNRQAKHLFSSVSLYHDMIAGENEWGETLYIQKLPLKNDTNHEEKECQKLIHNKPTT